MILMNTKFCLNAQKIIYAFGILLVLCWLGFGQSVNAQSISAISPSAPQPTAGDQSVVVYGSGFQSGLNVTVFFPNGQSGTLSGLQIQNVSSSSFSMLVNFNGNPGQYGIRVNNPNGGQSGVYYFLVQQQAANPSLSSISPATPTADFNNQSVIVYGSNFQSGLSVTVFFPNGQTGTLSGSQILNVSSSSFTMLINFNGNPGSYGIRVNNPNGGQSNTISFNVQAQVVNPSISSISPSTLTADTSNQNITVYGNNFVNGLTVTVIFPNGQTGFLSGSQINNVSSSSFNMLISFNGIAGQYGIRVNNPSGGQSNIFYFNVQAQVLNPAISAISPSTLTANSNNQSVIVSGSNFVSGLAVTVIFPNGQIGSLSGAQIQNVSSSSFTMLINFNGNPGQYGIRVNNPNNTQSNVFTFNVQAQVLNPVISSIAPTSPIASAGDQNIIVNGSNFVSGLSVTVTFPNGQVGQLTGTQIQNVTASSFTMRINFNGNSGQYSIRVNNPNSTQSNVYSFNTQMQVQNPVISSIAPANPIASVGDQSVSVNGSNFVAGLTVMVTFPNGQTGSLSGAQIVNVTATSFTMRINFNGNAGQYSIRVTNPNNTQSNVFGFSTQAQVQNPVISSISPANPLPTAGDQSVIVNGSNFVNGLTVFVTFPNGQTGTLSGTQIQNVTATSFTMRINFNGNAGQYSIRVNNPNNTQSNVFGFSTQTQVQNPVISSIAPANPLPAAGDQNITVNGSNFVNGLTVTVTFPNGQTGSLSGTQIQNVTATSFTMRINFNGNAGQYSIRVNNPNNTQSNVFGFSTQTQVQNPVISSIAPASPSPAAGDQNITVNGNNFVSGLSVIVTFPNGQTGTLSGTQIQNVTATSFTMRINFNGNPGQYGIKVNNPNNTQSNLFSFATQAASPVISSIAPANPAATAGDQSVTVNGSNFVSGLSVIVTFPNAQSVTLSGTQIQSVTATSFTMRINFNGNAGQYSIRVNNPNGAQSNNFSFSTQAQVQNPVISSIAPASPSPVAGDQNITVNGSNFVSGLTVTVTFPNGQTGQLSGTQIQNVTASSFTMRINFNGNSGQYSIRVNNPNGALSNSFSFSTQSQAQNPVISSIAPASPSPAAGDQSVTVNGSNFVTGLTVTVTFPNGQTGTLTGTQIQSVTATSFIMRINFNGNAGQYSIRVNNPNNTQSNVFGFSTQTQTQNPVISSIAPTVPLPTVGDQSVVVNGSNFVNGLTVTVTFPNGQAVTLSGTQIQSVAATSFTMRINFNGNAGQYRIRVNNPNNTQSNTYSFNVQAQTANPVISSISPVIPIITGGNQTVLVNGANFQANLTVTVTFPNGQSGTLSGTQIQDVTATSFAMLINFNGNAGRYGIKVNNSNNTQSNTFEFQAQAQTVNPAISAIAPASPTATVGDQRVAVNGGNFVNGLIVTVTFPSGQTSNLSGAQIQSVTASSFAMLINFNGVAGQYKIRVVNPGGAQSELFSFNVAPQAQQGDFIISANPTSRTVTAGQSATYDITVQSQNGFAGTVNLFALNLPGNQVLPRTGFIPQSINVTATTPGTSQLTIATDSVTPLGVTRTTVEGRTNTGGVRNTAITLDVKPSTVPAPQLTSVSPVSTPYHRIPFNAVLVGTNFNTSTIEVVVTEVSGPCQNDGTCRVQRTALSNVSSTALTAPIRLDEGTYSIYVQNGAGARSNAKELIVYPVPQTPVIDDIQLVPANPLAGQPFDITLTGRNFDKVTINALITGGSCVASPCSPNVINTNQTTSTSVTFRATLNDAAFYQIKLRNGNSNDFSNTKPISISLTAPSRFTISGLVGIKDKLTNKFWPLNGDGVSVAVSLYKTGTTVLAASTTIDSNARYELTNIEKGIYNIVAKINYVDQPKLNTKINKEATWQKVITIDQSKEILIELSPVVVLVHGGISDFDTWNEWDVYLRKSGYISITPSYKANIFDSENNENNDINYSDDWEGAAANVIVDATKTIRSLSKGGTDLSIPSLFYIGHSQGGLVGRVILSGRQKNHVFASAIKHIFMVGTPNSGLASGLTKQTFASIKGYDYLSRDNMMRVFNVKYPNFGERLSESRITAIAGHANQIASDNSNDELVTVESVYKIMGKTENCFGSASAISTPVSCEMVTYLEINDRCSYKNSNVCSFPFFHAGKYDDNPFTPNLGGLITKAAIQSILEGEILPRFDNPVISRPMPANAARLPEAELFSSENLFTQQVVEQSQAKSQQVSVSFVTVPAKQTQTISTNISATDFANFIVNSNAGIASAILTSPNGKTYSTGTSVQSNGQNNTGNVDILSVTDDPAPGKWDVKITAGDDDAKVVVSTEEKSTIGIEGYHRNDRIFLNQPSSLLVKWTGNKTQVANLAVQAKIYNSANTLVETVTLYDDGQHEDAAAGDGIFGGKTRPLTVAGQYVASFEGQGIYQGFPLKRLAADPIQVLPASRLFTGQFTDTQHDQNADGKVDSILLTTPVNLLEGGNYAVSGDLYDAQGYFIGSATTQIEASEAGVQSPKLEFDLSKVNCLQFNSAFSLRNLLIRDVSSSRLWDKWTEKIETKIYSGLVFGCATAPTGLVVSSVQPSTLIKGDAAQIRIIGKSFNAGTKVSFGNGIIVNSYSVIAEDQLIAQVTTTATTSLGARDITITNTDGRIATLASGFTVTEDQLPALAISAPTANQVLRGTVNVIASATDDRNVQRVEFFLDGTLVRTVTAFPYKYDWNTITSTNGKHTLLVKVFDSIGQSTTMQQTVWISNSLTVVSAADYGGVLAGDSIAAVFGTGMASSALAATVRPLPTSLGGVSVKVKDSQGNERLAGLFYVSGTQINFLIPADTVAGVAEIFVTTTNGTNLAGALNVAAISPALFSANGSGQGLGSALALRVKPGNVQSYEPVVLYDRTAQKFNAVPINLGPDTEQVYLILYGTGVRKRSTLAAVTAKIGGVDAQVLYAGAQGSLIGLDQINLLIPRALIGRGEVDVELNVDGQASNKVRVAIR